MGDNLSCAEVFDSEKVRPRAGDTDIGDVGSEYSQWPQCVERIPTVDNVFSNLNIGTLFWYTLVRIDRSSFRQQVILSHNALYPLVIHGDFRCGYLHGDLSRAPFPKICSARGANCRCKHGVVFLLLQSLWHSLFPRVVATRVNACNYTKKCHDMSLLKLFYESVSDPGRYSNGAILGIPRVRAKKSFSASVYAHFAL